jgi:hypothetical protein
MARSNECPIIHLDHLKIQTNAAINIPTPSHEARKPSISTDLGFMISKSG